ncbi:hypothetical protein TNCV_3947621 [Trichonephila clavipes]|nr:hypothetical protein TNCV_3947621 [Trichonephila clavipes]
MWNVQFVHHAESASLASIGDEKPDAKPFDLIPALSSKVPGVYEIRIQIIVPHPEMHLVLFFGASTPASSIPVGQRILHRPALSSKVIGTPKIRFQILIPHRKMHTGLTFGTPVLAISVAKGNENPYSGLECKAFPPNSDNIRKIYGSF